MNWTRVAVTVGLACVAANLLVKGRREAAGAGDDGLDPFPSLDRGLPGRMRATTASTYDGGSSGDLFQSTSQDSPSGRAPRLSDFARGA